MTHKVFHVIYWKTKRFLAPSLEYAQFFYEEVAIQSRNSRYILAGTGLWPSFTPAVAPAPGRRDRVPVPARNRS